MARNTMATGQSERGSGGAGFSFPRVGRGNGFTHGHGASNPQMRAVAAFCFLLFGALSSYLAYLALQPVPEAPQASAKPTVIQKEIPIEMVDVFVPIQQIERGRRLDPHMFITVSRPKIAVPDNMVSGAFDFAGQFARVTIPPNQPITLDVITNARPANEVVSNIPDGSRAIAINVDATTGVEGWARAGAIVDVHWITDAFGEKSASLLVENAKVLSAERKADPEADPKKPLPATVTLLVPDEAAHKISLASTGGKIVLLLRGAEDQEPSTIAGSTIGVHDLLGRGGAPSGAVEGVVRLRDRDGSVEEWAIIQGKLFRKDGQ